MAIPTPAAAQAPEPPGAPSPLVQLSTQYLAELDTYHDTPRSRRSMMVNNLSRYFVIYQVPSNLDEFQRLLGTASRVSSRFAANAVDRAAALARQRGHAHILQEDMAQTLGDLLPNEPTPWDEVSFFPRATTAERVVIETYDLDAYRDTGAPWEVLLQLGRDLEIDPEAMPMDIEAVVLLARATISHGLLALRVGGRIAADEFAAEMQSHHLREAAKIISQRATSRSDAPPGGPVKGSVFADRTARSGIRFRHVSSRWLAQLRRIFPKTTTFSGGGVAAADLDGDSWADLIICGGQGCEAFFNRGDGTFRDAGGASGLEVNGEARMPLPADFDNDGDQDVFITYARDTNRLFENQGDGTFVDITAKSGLLREGDVSGAAIAFDADGDGLLDIYVANFGNFLGGELACCGKDATNGMANRLYRNLGGLRFSDITADAGVGDTGWAQAVSHADIDRDGDQDIYVANDFGRNDLLLNDGDGTFTSAGSTSSSDGYYHGMNVSFADLNHDQYADIFITNIWHWHPLPAQVTETNTLLLSRPGPAVQFERCEDAAFVGRDTGWSWAGMFFDFDNDADDDLFIANGFNGYFTAIQQRTHPDRPEDLYPINNSYEANLLLRNDDGLPTEPILDSGAELPEVNSRSVALLDFDHDGDLDLAVTTFHSEFHLFENMGTAAANGWLTVELVGDPAVGSSLDAIGAQLVARGADGLVVWRTVTGGEGYLGRSTLPVEFGLGASASVDLEIDWPGGERTVHPGIRANQAIRIRQGTAEVEPLWTP